ncbi:MAG: NTP transferase domain-containing protein [candidate division NC10 bacterium]|nr:NTP transferase domain-containing protein [candidate division NC10 bacterium]MDE2321492.1 NTP transferase domain-containing protein [candidate division NC10 bacterium]
MKAVILAGGLGTRLRPFTEVIPKPLLPLGEESLMEIQIHALRNHGLDEIFIATNYMSDYVEAFLGNGSKHGVTLHFSREKKPLGTCGPLTLLRKELTEPFIVMNGDILTKLNFQKFYDFGVRANSLLTVATKTIFTPFSFGNVTADDNDHIVDVEEKPNLRMEIIAGVYCMKPEIFSWIPDNEYFGMDTLIKKLLSAHQHVSRYVIHEYWLDIGQVEDYTKAQQDYRTYFSDKSK